MDLGCVWRDAKGMSSLEGVMKVRRSLRESRIARDVAGYSSVGYVGRKNLGLYETLGKH